MSGRLVLVTGASSGIGREIAVLLGSLNARVVAAGRDPGRLEETLGMLSGSGHSTEQLDLSDTARIPKWVQSIAARTGPFDGLVHAAGKQMTMPVRFLTEKNLDEVMRANLYSAVMLARGFCHKSCHPGAGGSIVFLSSVMALAGSPALSAYSASKGALLSLTRSLATELAPDHIRVNCVLPGYVETPMLEELRSLLTEPQWNELRDAHPLGLGTPRDVANAVAFLLADTGRWITGSSMVVDGGYSIH